MVYIELNGRIGNNLFQIAAGASYAKRHNLEFCAVCHDGYYLPEPDNCYIKDYVKQFKTNILRKIRIKEGRPQEECYYYYEKDGNYHPIPFHENILLYGVFHSYKYFDAELVRELYAISPQEREYINSKYGHILKSGEVTSIHVRRGDYYRQPHKYPVSTMSYFNKAIDYIGKDKKYLILSDDIDWCKQHFIGDNFYFSDYEKPVIDLYIQTLCTNNIISNSTFSWWGAWLNANPGKIVICPDPWFGRAFKSNNTKDLIPDNWIQIKNRLPFKLEMRASALMLGENMIKIVPNSLKQYIKGKLR